MIYITGLNYQYDFVPIQKYLAYTTIGNTGSN